MKTVKYLAMFILIWVTLFSCSTSENEKKIAKKWILNSITNLDREPSKVIGINNAYFNFREGGKMECQWYDKNGLTSLKEYNGKWELKEVAKGFDLTLFDDKGVKQETLWIIELNENQMIINSTTQDYVFKLAP
jgi:Lipocalin-like domain